MRCKCKLSFSILMISTSFVQAAAVGSDEALNHFLKKMEFSGKIVQSGHVLIVPFVSTNTKIEDGGVEIVENSKSSVSSTIDPGGKQIVTRGGNAMTTLIDGGKQFVFEEKGFMGTASRRSSAYDVVIRGKDGKLGQQNVYDGGNAWNTKIMGGGEQNLYKGYRQEGGYASNTQAFKNGRQNVLAGGRASSVILEDDALQVVYPGGYVENLMIKDRASSWVYFGAKLAGKTEVNGHGKLNLYFGDTTSYMTQENLSIDGRNDEILFLVGARNGKDSAQMSVKNLGGDGGSVQFFSVPYDPHHFLLHIENLSGRLHFQLNISSKDSRSDYLMIDNGSGSHTISVLDSGAEITDFITRRSDFITELNLITEKSTGEGANFTLANHSGKETTAVDGGTYMYELLQRAKSGNERIWYLGIRSDNPRRSNLRPQRVTKKTQVSSSEALSIASIDRQGRRHDSLQRLGKKIKNSDLSSSLLTEETSTKPSNRRRPPRHLSESSSASVPLSSVSHRDGVIIPNSENRFSEKIRLPVVSLSSDNTAVDRIDLEKNSLGSESEQRSVFSLDAVSVADNLDNQDHLFPYLEQNFFTTPSTDAVLSMSVAPELIFNSELQAVRSGRGILDRSKKNTALWTHAIKSRENTATGHTDFKLEQTGIVLGINGLSEFANGEFYLGGFGSYDKARVSHARGGTSSINIYSVGAYATYFDHSGWYVDNVFKYSHYDNNLCAVSTNGISIQGDYKQWAMGTSLETGYRFKTSQKSWFQPYAQLSWLKVEGKGIKLSNDMTGDMSPSISLRSELGLSVGYEFGSHENAPSTAYITAAWLRENIKNNHTTINKKHKFITNLSGNIGKFGIGLSGFVSDKLNLYAEVHYLKGRKIKQSLQGIFGMRYSF
ncbi:BafA family autotransporter [Bartonella sp. B41]